VQTLEVNGLVPIDDGPPITRCAICRVRDAAGPCMRCKKSVCGDCCELTTGGTTTFALCLSCVKRGGTSLASAWLGLLGWLGLIMLALIGVGVALRMLR
jgi:hypothetical protein